VDLTGLAMGLDMDFLTPTGVFLELTMLMLRK
jgi:hypothetical protein